MRELTKLIMLFLVLLCGCRKDIDEYFERPQTLADPIYQQLESRGNFTSLLSLIDKTNYKYTLSSGGFWTLMAPNDDAFQTYLAEKGYSSVNEIDSVLASQIVRYLLIYDGYNDLTIDNYQNGSRQYNHEAFRRKTSYYRWVYSDTTNGTVRLVIDRVNNSSFLSANDNNYKYIPYFTSSYFNALSLNETDYNYFYTNAAFSNFNICGGKSIGESTFAENGYFIEINKVVEPLPNIYEYIKSKPKYSAFKNLLDRFANFTVNIEFQNRYLQATGSSETVYHKFYNDSLAFSPNGESYSNNSTDTQQDSWSIVVPENDAVSNYVKNVLAEFYGNDPNRVPNYIIAEFINSHMWQTAVWPSNLNKTYDYLSEYVTLDPNSDIKDKQILSNGMFYGSSRVYESRTFTSVFAQSFLNPDYSYMLRLMNSNNLKTLLKRKTVNYTIFMVKDSALAADRFSYNTNYNTWWYNGTTTISNELVSNANEKINRDFKLQIIANKIEDANSAKNTVETYGGECITYNNGTVFGSGNEDSSEVANILGYRDYDNGRVYFIDKMLKYGQYSLYGKLRILAGYNPRTATWGSKTDYYPFYKLIETSGLLTVTNGDTAHATISGVSSGDVYTVLVPDKASITLAQTTNDSSDLSNIHPCLYAYNLATTALAQTVNKNFIKYHFLNKIIIPDGNTDRLGIVNTASKDLDGNTRIVKVIDVTGSLTVQGYNTSGSVTLIPGSSNRLASRAVFHQVNGFLKYE